MKRMVIPCSTNCARFYALFKIHELTFPFHPDICSVGITSEKLACFLL